MSSTIDDLPPETLEHILSFLPLQDRKNASLVCRRWCDQAMSFRAMKNITLYIQREFDRAAELLPNSRRSYRVLKICLSHRETASEVASVLKILDKLGPTVEEFRMYVTCSAEDFKAMLWKMPHLKTLAMLPVNKDDVETGSSVRAFPVLEKLHTFEWNDAKLEDPQFSLFRMAPNLCHLVISPNDETDEERWFRVLEKFAPQLKSLKIKFVTLGAVSIKKLSLENLEELTIQGLQNGSYELRMEKLFTSSSKLISLKLDFPVTKPVLNLSGRLFPRLQELMFLMPDDIYKDTFYFLRSLEELKKLSVAGKITATMLKNFVPLPNVREFSAVCLPEVPAPVVKQLSLLLPNLQMLKLSGKALSGGIEFLRQFCKYFTQLRCLEVDGIVYQERKPMDAFDRIGHLVHLEELHLSHMPVALSAFPPNTIKRLMLKWVIIMDIDRWQSVAPLNFPHLRYLEVTKSVMIREDDYPKMRQAFPNCVTRFEPACNHYLM